MADTRPSFARLPILVMALALGGCAAPASSGPPASPKVSCVGVPPGKCDEAVASVARSLPNTAPVSIDVTCVSGTCSTDTGVMEIVLTLADGSQLRSSPTSWSTGVEQAPGNANQLPVDDAVPVIPSPDIPLEPVCQGVPISMCRTMAETAFGELSNQAVVQIVVRCSAPPCTDRGGTGDTVVTYADGTIRSTTWQYAS